MSLIRYKAIRKEGPNARVTYMEPIDESNKDTRERRKDKDLDTLREAPTCYNEEEMKPSMKRLRPKELDLDDNDLNDRPQNVTVGGATPHSPTPPVPVCDDEDDEKQTHVLGEKGENKCVGINATIIDDDDDDGVDKKGKDKETRVRGQKGENEESDIDIDDEEIEEAIPSDMPTPLQSEAPSPVKVCKTVSIAGNTHTSSSSSSSSSCTSFKPGNPSPYFNTTEKRKRGKQNVVILHEFSFKEKNWIESCSLHPTPLQNFIRPGIDEVYEPKVWWEDDVLNFLCLDCAFTESVAQDIIALSKKISYMVLQLEAQAEARENKFISKNEFIHQTRDLYKQLTEALHHLWIYEGRMQQFLIYIVAPNTMPEYLACDSPFWAHEDLRIPLLLRPRPKNPRWAMGPGDVLPPKLYPICGNRLVATADPSKAVYIKMRRALEIERLYSLVDQSFSY